MPSIVLYDGVCGLCNRMVQFVLKLDRNAAFRFASLQSPFAARILTRHGANPTDLDTFYVVVNDNEAGEKLLSRSYAVAYVLKQVGGIWKLAAVVLDMMPRVLCELAYNAVARNRYRIFGRYDSCPLPSPETRSRFLGL